MVNFTLNGKKISNLNLSTINNLVEEYNLPSKNIAIELNQEILLRSLYQTTIINENDQIEIVTMVGGG